MTTSCSSSHIRGLCACARYHMQITCAHVPSRFFGAGGIEGCTRVPSCAMPPKQKKSHFILVRWLQDETVGVMPQSAVHKDAQSSTYVGSMVQVKYGRKFYDAEILKIASDCQQLNKVCDALINFKVTREELLRQAEVEVDSTTEGDTPVKKPRLESKVIKPAKAKPSEKKKLAFSKVEAAKSRAKEIFSQMAPPVESDLDSCSEEESDLEMVKQMREQQKLIATLKQQLQEKSNSPTTMVTKNVVLNSRFEALQKNTTLPVGPCEGTSSVTPAYDSPLSDDTLSSTQFDDCYYYSQDTIKTPSPKKDNAGSYHNSRKTPSSTESTSRSCFHGTLMKTPSRKTDAGSSFSKTLPMGSTFCKAVKTPPTECLDTESHSRFHKTMKTQLDTESHSRFHKTMKTEPTRVELVTGYGVMVTQRQLDEAEGESNGSPTRLIRNLISVFFSREELARSSCYGSRQNPALDKDILLACIKFVQKKYTVAKTALVDAVNDKCSNCRRKERKRH